MKCFVFTCICVDVFLTYSLYKQLISVSSNKSFVDDRQDGKMHRKINYLGSGILLIHSEYILVRTYLLL